jgi:hypothetical protein
MNAAALVFHPRRKPRLARLGDWMAANRRLILGVQWAIVLFYAFLVVLPAFLPHPHPEARLFSGDFGASSFVDGEACALDGTPLPPQDKAPYAAQWHERLVLLAQYLFWGVWWPFVILSIMFMGRVWCGVLCPEGALAEFASRHGRGNAIPKWLRWGGWPFLAFVLTTLYGQLVSVYEYPQAALLILGGSTVAAVAVGWLYGKGKRVWCRYLCPVSGVFALLARIAPVCFRIDRAAWDSQPGRSAAVDCAPLLDVKHMTSAAQCHACGRCSGHRDAVELSARSPNAEMLAAKTPRTSEALLLVFGMLGVAIGAFQWTVSPWFVALRQRAAEWLVEQARLFWPLESQRALVAAHPLPGSQRRVHLARRRADPRLHRHRGGRARRRRAGGTDFCRTHREDRLARPRPLAHPARRRRPLPRPVDDDRHPPARRGRAARLAARRARRAARPRPRLVGLAT